MFGHPHDRSQIGTSGIARLPIGDYIFAENAPPLRSSLGQLYVAWMAAKNGLLMTAHSGDRVASNLNSQPVPPLSPPYLSRRVSASRERNQS